MAYRSRIRCASASICPLLTMTVASPSPSRVVAITPYPTPDSTLKSMNGAREMNVASTTKTLSFGIEENGGHDLDLGIAAVQRTVRAQALSEPRRAAPEKTQSDPRPERR